MRERPLTIALVVAGTLLAAPAQAQTEPDVQRSARVGVDSSVSFDLFRGQNTVDRPNVIIDVTTTVRLGRGWSVYVRPWFRQPRTSQWDKQIYQAALQYSRPGRVATRIDAGYLSSPIGLGLFDSRPSMNPTIGPHYSYFTPLPAFEKGAPKTGVIALTYPLGGQLTASTERWDARVAVVDSMPPRSYILNMDNGSPPPRRTPALVVGGGITSTTGLRVGLSLARGDYATAAEMTSPARGARTATMASIEAEYAFGYTKLSGELTRDTFETAGGHAIAYAWFVQGMQTLAPRWFVAARQEGMRAPTAISGVIAGTRPLMHVTELTAGYRLTPDFTVRGSFIARKAFTRTDWDQQGAVSLVWARRWW
jgi:hypothetical protein